MAAERPGLVNLGPFDDDAFLCLVHHPEVHVLVGLLMRAQIAIPLDVGDAGICCEVVFLHVLQEIHEAVVVMGPILLIDVVGHDRKGAEAVEPRAPLVARPHIASQDPVDLHPHHKVLDRLGRQGEPVDPLPRERREGRDEISELFVFRQFIGRPGCIDPCPNTRMIHRVLHPFPKHVDRGFQFPQTLQVFFKCLDGHLSSPVLELGWKHSSQITLAPVQNPYGLSIEKGYDVLDRILIHNSEVFLKDVAEVRGQKHIIKFADRVIRRKGLHSIDIDGCAGDLFSFECLYQSRLINKRPPRRID